MTFNSAILDTITGFLLPNEAALLYRLASEVLEGGVIIELGSYQGLSTCTMGLAIQPRNGVIYAIDPHIGQALHTSFLPSDADILQANIKALGLSDVVKPVQKTSIQAAHEWEFVFFSSGSRIDLLFIDADHRYEAVKADLEVWLRWVKPDGKIALHDYANPDFPGVRQAVDEFIAAGQWRICEAVDTIVVLERVTD